MSTQSGHLPEWYIGVAGELVMVDRKQNGWRWDLPMIDWTKGSEEFDDQFGPNADAWHVAREREKAEREEADIRAKVSPAGALRLTKLLDVRRIEFGIPDNAFREEATFERCYLFQIQDSVKSDGTVGSGVILAPDATQNADDTQASRAIIVSAGLRGLDILRSNGMDLGHIVRIARSAPFSFVYDHIAARPWRLIIVNAGEICGSEDLAHMLRNGERHVGVMDDGQTHTINGAEPLRPWNGE